MLKFLDFLFPPRSDEEVLREATNDTFLSHLAPCILETTRPGAVALMSIRDPRVRAAIHEAKYHGSEKAFTLLALALTEYLREDAGLAKSVLVPVPLSSVRRKERGFNQVEEVVTRAAKELGRTVDAGLLVRTRDTASQVSLPRKEREENMRGAFSAAYSPDPSYTYIVVDDVTTTGATFQAAVDALRAAGAVHIAPLALAH
jgi:ComF family protein